MELTRRSVVTVEEAPADPDARPSGRGLPDGSAARRCRSRFSSRARPPRSKQNFATTSDTFACGFATMAKALTSTSWTEGAPTGHWGLPGIRGARETVSGRFEIWSEAGAGTGN